MLEVGVDNLLEMGENQVGMNSSKTIKMVLGIEEVKGSARKV